MRQHDRGSPQGSITVCSGFKSKTGGANFSRKPAKKGGKTLGGSPQGSTQEPPGFKAKKRGGVQNFCGPPPSPTYTKIPPPKNHLRPDRQNEKINDLAAKSRLTGLSATQIRVRPVRLSGLTANSWLYSMDFQGPLPTASLFWWPGPLSSSPHRHFWFGPKAISGRCGLSFGPI